jgi:uncharacterized repeat protein (TIGR01451 family)
VTVTSRKYLNLTNTIPAGSVSSDEGYTNSLPTIASLSTLQGLGVSKGFSPPYVGVGVPSTLIITLVNSFDPFAIDPQTLTGVQFTDSLPSGLVVAPTPNASTTCADATVTALAGTGIVLLQNATLTAGGFCFIEVDVTASGTGAYNNSIGKSEVTSSEGTSNTNPASAVLNVVTQPTIAKAFSVSPVQIGQVSRLTVTINNSSGIALTGTGLTDTLPMGLAIAATPNATTTCSNGVVTANAGDNQLSVSGAVLASGSSCTFSADVIANTDGSYANSIDADELVNDQGLSNPSAADDLLIVVPPASVAKSFNPVEIPADGITPSTLTITLFNSSSAAITLTADFVDALPGNVLVAPTPNLSSTCTGVTAADAGGTTVTLNSGAVIPVGSCTITVDVTSTVTGGYVNFIAAGQLQTSAGNNQDPAIATLGVGQPAPPTIEKAFSPTTIFADEIAMLTITLGNSNSTAITLTAEFEDVLPPDVFVADTPNVSGTCTLASVGASAGASSITYANGASIPAGGCTIMVDVTSSEPGAYTNVIPANELETTAGSPSFPAEAGLVVKTLTPPAVQKNFNPTTVNPGGISTLTIVLNNDNDSAITLLSDMDDTLPANVVVAADPMIGGTCTLASVSTGGSTITYANGATIPSGGCTITVDVTSPLPGGPYVNTIPAGELETTAGNNGAAAIASLLVNPFQPPSVSKSLAPTPLPVNGTAVLTISLRNGNSVPITLTSNFVDTLPGSVVIAANPMLLTSNTGDCLAANVTAIAGQNTVTWPAGNAIPADGGCTIQVKVTSPVAGSWTNSIPAGSVQTDAGNNAVGAIAPIRFLALPTNGDIELNKTIDPGTGAAGSPQTVR